MEVCVLCVLWCFTVSRVQYTPRTLRAVCFHAPITVMSYLLSSAVCGNVTGFIDDEIMSRH